MLTFVDLVLLMLIVVVGFFISQLILRIIEYKLTVKKGQEIADHAIANVYRRILALISEVRRGRSNV